MKERIPQDSVDRMMVKCGRRCCICRRFRPTKLQVHHIMEQAKGGSDDEDNLIVTCLSCHTDVHTQVPFARRFSQGELKGHREALIALVLAGSLPTNDSDDTEDIFARIRNHSSTVDLAHLKEEAVEILLKAAMSDGQSQGHILISTDLDGVEIISGRTQIKVTSGRNEATYRAAIKDLEAFGLIENAGNDWSYDVTYDGYLVADEIAASATSTDSD